MTSTLTKYFCIFVALFAWSFNISANAATTEQQLQVAGVVLFATGQREQVVDGGQKQTLKRGDNVYVGDTINTGSDGHLQLRMVDNAYLSLKPNSKLSILAYTHAPDNPDAERVKIHLEQGVARSVTGDIGQRKKSNFRFNTPVAAIGVRGTDFSVYTTDALSQVMVSQGGIAISPYNSGCNQKGFGACSGDQVKELFGDQADRYLELRKGDDSADILEGRLEKLIPVLDEIFKFSVINAETRQSVSDSPKSYALSAEVQSLLALALDREESLLNHESDSLNSDGSGPDLEVDPDNDGIATLLEERWLMDPANADSDRDGLSDLDELWAHTDPLQADTDQDGIADGADLQPLQRSQFEIGDQIVIKEQVPTLEVLAETSMQQVNSGLWRMNIALQGDEQINLNIAFDAQAGSWWGEPDSLAVLDQLMTTQSWVEIQKYWVLNGLLYGDLDNDTVSDLVSKWRQTPVISLGDANLGMLVKRSETIFATQTVTYQSNYQSSLSESGASGATLKNVTVDSSNNQFQAELITDSGEEIQLVGRTENGVINGSVGDYQLQGTFVEGVDLAVVVSGPQDSFVSYLNFSQLQDYQLEPVLQVDSVTNWGRWSNYATLSEADVESLKGDGQTLLSNRHFTLMKEVDREFVMPETGQYSFKVDRYDAVYVDQGVIQPAKVESASLNIAIPQNRFSMHMGVSSPGLEGVEALRSFGEIDQLGQLTSDDILSDTRVDGFLGNAGENAHLLFEKDLTEQSYISGSSFWNKVN